MYIAPLIKCLLTAAGIQHTNSAVAETFIYMTWASLGPITGGYSPEYFERSP